MYIIIIVLIIMLYLLYTRPSATTNVNNIVTTYDKFVLDSDLEYELEFRSESVFHSRKSDIIELEFNYAHIPNKIIIFMRGENNFSYIMRAEINLANDILRVRYVDPITGTWSTSEDLGNPLQYFTSPVTIKLIPEGDDIKIYFNDVYFNTYTRKRFDIVRYVQVVTESDFSVDGTLKYYMGEAL
jgi:hypothetical protein